MRHWVERISIVEIVHCILRGDEEKKASLASWMAQKFQHLECKGLTHIDYVAALKWAKSSFTNIPRKIMRPSLVVYLARTLDYLMPGVVIGVAPEVRAQVTSFVQAVASGDLTETEVRITAPVPQLVYYFFIVFYFIAKTGGRRMYYLPSGPLPNTH